MRELYFKHPGVPVKLPDRKTVGLEYASKHQIIHVAVFSNPNAAVCNSIGTAKSTQT